MTMNKYTKEAISIFTQMGFNEEQIKGLLNSIQVMSNVGETSASDSVDKLANQL